MKKSFKSVLTPLVGYLVVIGIVLAVIGVLAMFGGVFMHIFGFQYASVASLVFFFVIVTAISIPIDSLSNAVAQGLLKKGFLQNKQGFLYICVDMVTTFVAMSLVDYFMDSIQATPLSILLFTLTMSLITVYLGKKGC